MALKQMMKNQQISAIFIMLVLLLMMVLSSLSAAAVADASGAALDQGENLVVVAQPTDVPVGILLNDVVNKDARTRTQPV